MRQFKFDLEEFIRAAKEAGGVVTSGKGELFVGGVQKSVSDSIEAAFPSKNTVQSHVQSSITAKYRNSSANEEYPTLTEMILAA